MVQQGHFTATRCWRVVQFPGGVGPSIHSGAMTTASVSSATGPASGDAVLDAPDRGAADGLARLRLVLDRELIGVRRHELELAGRVPDSVRPHVDVAQGML